MYLQHSGGFPVGYKEGVFTSRFYTEEASGYQYSLIVLGRVCEFAFEGVGVWAGFKNFNFTLKVFISKDFLKVPKSYKKRQNHNLTKDGVIWLILKINKIRVGMEIQFFVLCFRICVRGVP